MPAPAAAGGALELLTVRAGREDFGAPALLFVHGWPDDEGLWFLQRAFFAPHFHLALVRLPWFSTAATAARDGAARGYSRWGYDLDELGAAVARTACALRLAGAPRVVAVAHDWGAAAAQIADVGHPGALDAVVALDVGLPRWALTGPRWRADARAAAALAFLGWVYMWWAAAAFLFADAAPGPAARTAQRTARNMTQVGLHARPLARARAGRDAGALAAFPAVAGTHPLSGYPYYYLYASFVKGLLGIPLARGRRVIVPGAERLASWEQFPTCPTLFMYGADGVMFHEREWEAALRKRTDGSKVVAVEGAGHWLHIEKPDEVNETIAEWLRSLEK